MSEKSRIKVIKRGEIVPTPKKKRGKKASRETPAREMVSTVTGWVADVKKRKSDEAKAAVDLLPGRTTLSN